MGNCVNWCSHNPDVGRRVVISLRREFGLSDKNDNLLYAESPHQKDLEETFIFLISFVTIIIGILSLADQIAMYILLRECITGFGHT
jgi:hypothetical protein